MRLKAFFVPIFLFVMLLTGCLSLLIGNSWEKAQKLNTAFFDLVKSGTPQDVKRAIDEGAEVNSKDSENWTPLMSAAWNNGNPEVISSLLSAGARIDDQDIYGFTALMYAAYYNENPLIVDTLIKAGANIEIRDKKSAWSALMLAAMYNPNSEVIVTLIKAGGPDLKQRDSDGWTQAQRKLQAIDKAAIAAQKTEFISQDGKFKIYIPIAGKKQTSERDNQNRNLITLMEKQVRNRPVVVSFSTDRDQFYRFTRWMVNQYQLITPVPMTEAYYLDKGTDNDYVIIASMQSPGLSIFAMTYEYFAATH